MGNRTSTQNNTVHTPQIQEQIQEPFMDTIDTSSFQINPEPELIKSYNLPLIYYKDTEAYQNYINTQEDNNPNFLALLISDINLQSVCDWCDLSYTNYSSTSRLYEIGRYGDLVSKFKISDVEYKSHDQTIHVELYYGDNFKYFDYIGSVNGFNNLFNYDTVNIEFYKNSNTQIKNALPMIALRLTSLRLRITFEGDYKLQGLYTYLQRGLRKKVAQSTNEVSYLDKKLRVIAGMCGEFKE